MSILEVREGVQKQTATEIIVYSVDTSNWVASPTNPVATVWDESTGTDVTTVVMPSSTPSVGTNTITLSPLKLLTVGRVYRVEVAFTVGASTYECYFRVKCEV